MGVLFAGELGDALLDFLIGELHVHGSGVDIIFNDVTVAYGGQGAVKGCFRRGELKAGTGSGTGEAAVSNHSHLGIKVATLELGGEPVGGVIGSFGTQVADDDNLAGLDLVVEEGVVGIVHVVEDMGGTPELHQALRYGGLLDIGAIGN